MAATELSGVSEIKVEARAGAGKETARKIRNQGMIPGVFYGARHEPVSFMVAPGALKKALTTPKLLNTLLRLVSDNPEINGRVAMVKEIQRHPLTRAYLHVDLMEVYEDRPVRAWVPINVLGHAAGVDQGGTLDQHMRHVELKCAAYKIPNSIEIDVSALMIGDSIKLSQLPLEPGVELLGERQASVVSVVAPRVLEEVAVAAVEGEEGEAAAAGEEGKPAEAAGEKGAAKPGEKGGEEKADKGKEKPEKGKDKPEKGKGKGGEDKRGK
jgi:large subunit ribosomal protein L25